MILLTAAAISLGPVAAHQHVGQGDYGARLAAAGGHHQQGLALVVYLKGFANAAHGTVLVVALDDVGVDNRIGQLLATGTALNQQLKLLLFEKALNWPGRVARVVPQSAKWCIGW